MIRDKSEEQREGESKGGAVVTYENLLLKEKERFAV